MGRLGIIMCLSVISGIVSGQSRPSPVERDSLVHVLFKVEDDDQDYRQEQAILSEKPGHDSVEMAEIRSKIRVADSVNLIKVEAILDKYSWLGPDILGDQCNTTLFLVIQHSDLATQEKYLPMLRAAVKDGRAKARHLAMMEDRVNLAEGRKQVYGSQMSWDTRTNTFGMLPLEDPDHVEERRAAVGLEPLSTYLGRHGLKWDAERYKKGLPLDGK